MKKTAQNDITGAWLVSKPNNEMFEKNWDLIFGKKKKVLEESIKENEEVYKELSRMDIVGQNGNEGLHYEEKEINKAWDQMKPIGKEFKYEPDDGQLTEEQYAKIKEYEYELNKSTGEPEKVESKTCECGVKGCE